MWEEAGPGAITTGPIKATYMGEGTKLYHGHSDLEGIDKRARTSAYEAEDLKQSPWAQQTTEVRGEDSRPEN